MCFILPHGACLLLPTLQMFCLIKGMSIDWLTDLDRFILLTGVCMCDVYHGYWGGGPSAHAHFLLKSAWRMQACCVTRSCLLCTCSVYSRSDLLAAQKSLNAVRASVTHLVPQRPSATTSTIRGQTMPTRRRRTHGLWKSTPTRFWSGTTLTSPARSSLRYDFCGVGNAKPNMGIVDLLREWNTIQDPFLSLISLRALMSVPACAQGNRLARGRPTVCCCGAW